MMVKLTKITPLLFAGAAGAAIAFSSVAGAEPAPPPCWNADGTPCASIGTAGPGGASGVIPGGPGGSAGPGGASGGIPGGPVGSAGPGGASGCIPGVGCATIPAP
ncbi:MAG: hypothetical protein WBV64_18995 [Mycobacterium sp.]